MLHGLLALLLVVAAAGSEIVDKIYWTHVATKSIYRANLHNGSDVESVLISENVHPRGIAIDEARCMLYFSDHASLSIKRAHLSGRDVQDFVQIEGAHATALWHSVAEDMLYWTQADARIKRTSLAGDGSVVEELNTKLSGYFYQRWGIAIDTGVSPSKAYFSDKDDFVIWRQDWGTSAEDALFVEDPKAVSGPSALGIDLVGRMLYWSDEGFGQIRRVSLDGNGGLPDVEVVAVNATPYKGILVDSANERVYFTEVGRQAKTDMISQVHFNGTRGWTIPLQKGPSYGLALMNATLTEEAACF